jgi:hypothetical protein
MPDSIPSTPATRALNRYNALELAIRNGPATPEQTVERAKEYEKFLSGDTSFADRVHAN